MDNDNDKLDAEKWRMFWGIYEQLGIYPASYNGEERDAYKTGWNDCSSQLLACFVFVSNFYESIDKSLPYKINKLLDDEIIWLKIDLHQMEVKMHVNCNDLFWWGCADSEDIELEEIQSFYNLCYDKDGNKNRWGSTIWACLRRKMRPQHPIEEHMKKEGAWTPELEAFPVRNFTG